jgi:hypothetical protein
MINTVMEVLAQYRDERARESGNNFTNDLPVWLPDCLGANLWMN